MEYSTYLEYKLLDIIPMLYLANILYTLKHIKADNEISAAFRKVRLLSNSMYNKDNELTTNGTLTLSTRACETTHFSERHNIIIFNFN